MLSIELTLKRKPDVARPLYFWWLREAFPRLTPFLQRPKLWSPNVSHNVWTLRLATHHGLSGQLSEDREKDRGRTYENDQAVAAIRLIPSQPLHNLQSWHNRVCITAAARLHAYTAATGGLNQTVSRTPDTWLYCKTHLRHSLILADLNLRPRCLDCVSPYNFRPLHVRQQTDVS